MYKSLILLATFLHLIPHPFGVSPVGATAIYAGASAPPCYAWLVPAVPLLLGNLLFGFYDPVVMAFVYAGFMLSSIAGRLLAVRQNPVRLATAAAAGAFVFYAVSNFAVWLVGMYPPTVGGLVACYINGLPYLGTGIAANFAYGALLFGLHHLLDNRLTSPEPV